MKYRFPAILTVLAIIVGLISPIHSAALTFSPGFNPVSEAVYMINLDRDQTVYEKNKNKKMYPASLTKIMTAIVVLDNLSEDELETTVYEAPLEVFDELYLTGALTVGYTRGELITAKDLLYSMLVYSACESAGILAYNVGGGSTAHFIDMMNEKADEIGCIGTHFVNAHGIHSKNQYTNAEDMAKIVKYALDNYPVFKEIACTQSYELSATNVHEEGWRTITHSNKMTNPSSEYYYEYAMGIKTGTTDESGRNLVSIASKGGNNYLLVTMGAPMYDSEGCNSYGNFTDQIKLYDWAFSTIAYQQVIPEGKEITEVTVKMGSDSDFVRLITAEEQSMLWSNELDIDKLGQTIDTADFTDADGSVTAPIEKGQKLGTYTITLNGEPIATTDLIAQESISLSLWQYNLDKAKRFVNSLWFRLAAGIAFFLTALYIALLIINAVNREKRRNRRRYRRIKKNRRF